jgi:hypothetical protein
MMPIIQPAMPLLPLAMLGSWGDAGTSVKEPLGGLGVIEPMLVFLDFEASSLAKRSYPIEVAWVFEDGRAESHLIRPAPDWTDWDPQAEAIHGIARAVLERDGVPHDEVARRMVAELSDHDLRASAPSWDGKWLSALLRASGLRRHSLRLADSDAAILDAAREILGERLEGGELDGEAQALVARVEAERAAEVPAHRALADAQAERGLWLAVREAALAWRAGR